LTNPALETIESFEEWNAHQFPPDWSDANASTGEDLPQIYQVECERQHLAIEQIRTYGQVCIHSKRSLGHALQQKGRGLLVRNRIQKLVQLLWECDTFHVALAEATPGLEIKTIGFERGIMVGTGGLRFGWRNWPIVVHWNDSKAVLIFVADFWENFYRIDAEDRDKMHVVDQLCEMAELPLPGSCPSSVPRS
jgi:hypothetical protein